MNEYTTKEAPASETQDHAAGERREAGLPSAPPQEVPSPQWPRAAKGLVVQCMVEEPDTNPGSGLTVQCSPLPVLAAQWRLPSPGGSKSKEDPCCPHPSPPLDRGRPAWHDPPADLQASGAGPTFLEMVPSLPPPQTGTEWNPPSVPWNQGGRGSPRSPAFYRGGNIEAQGTENRSSSRGRPCPCPPPPALALSSQAPFPGQA